MSIATEITRLQEAKDNIRSSIENKGVSVPSGATLDSYSQYIDNIVRIQANWTESDPSLESYIQNKPTQLSAFTDNLGSSPTHTHSQYALDNSISNVGKSGKYSDLLNIPNTLPIQIITSNTTLEDDIDVGRMKALFVNNSSTVTLTMPGDSSRQYIVVALNVIVLALVSAGKLPHYESVVGGGSVSLSWTSSAEPYMMVFVVRLS